MKHVVNVSFYIKKNEMKKDGRCPVMAQLSVGIFSNPMPSRAQSSSLGLPRREGRRRTQTSFSTKMTVPLSLWASGRAVGKSQTANEINRRLDEIRASALSHYRQLSAVREHVTAEEVKTLLFMAFGQEALLAYFRTHNENFDKRVGVNRKKGSATSYWYALGHLTKFLKVKYKLSDIPFTALDRSFIEKYDLHLRIECGLSPGSIVLLTTRLTTIVGSAIAEGIITADPFAGYEPERPERLQKFGYPGASLVLGLYSFTLPNCEIKKELTGGKKTLVDALGLRAFALFKEKKMAVFFLFAMLLGAALQITNAFGDLFLSSFAADPLYADSFGVKHSVVLLSVSQMSETLFILAIPFSLKRYGIKNVMLISMFAWVLRFALFGLGDPGDGLWMLILSMIVYGMAFDFFNISGLLFVEQSTDSSIRASAQGVFMIMTNGLGAVFGSYSAGKVVQMLTVDGVTDWSTTWFIFAGYALVVMIAFALLFKYKHTPEPVMAK